MDNEREVKHLVEQSKMVFLQEVIEDFRRRQSQYDLGTEFAKTRKNRTILVPAVIGVMVLFFALSAAAITWYIEELTSDITVSIEEFADVNLRELLDSARRLDAEMDAAQRSRAELVRRLDREVEQVQAQARRDTELLETRNLSAQQRTQQAALIRSQEEERVAAIRSQYADELEAIDLEIDSLTLQLAQYDARQVEQAREREALLDNQRRVFELEMEQQASSYEERIERLTTENAQQVAELENHLANLEAALREAHQREINALVLRYNPLFEQGAVPDVLSGSPSLSSLSEVQPAAYATLLEDEDILSRAEFGELERTIAEVGTLIAALQDTPYRNRVPDVLDGIEARVASMVERYEVLRSGLSDAVAGRDARIARHAQELAAERERSRQALEQQRQTLGADTERFLHAMEALTSDARENGYIIDARNPNEVFVFMDRLHDVEVGGQGYVFRRDDELLAVIEFIETGNPARARVGDLYTDSGLRPFDRVLLQLQ